MSHAPDRARKYKEDPAPVASQKMVSRLCFPVSQSRIPLATPHPRLLHHRPHHPPNNNHHHFNPRCCTLPLPAAAQVPSPPPSLGFCTPLPPPPLPLRLHSSPTWYASPRQAALLPPTDAPLLPTPDYLPYSPTPCRPAAALSHLCLSLNWRRAGCPPRQHSPRPAALSLLPQPTLPPTAHPSPVLSPSQIVPLLASLPFPSYKPSLPSLAFPPLSLAYRRGCCTSPSYTRSSPFTIIIPCPDRPLSTPFFLLTTLCLPWLRC
jgi:hypothetical protein